MKKRFYTLTVLVLMTVTAVVAQEPTNVKIPTGTDLYAYFQTNPLSAESQTYVIDLEPDGQYTVSHPLDFGYNKITLHSTDAAKPAAIILNSGANLVAGNSFIMQNVNMDASATAQPVIELYNYETAPDGILAKPGNYYIIDQLTLKGCKFTGVGGSLIYDNFKPYGIKSLTIDNTLIELKTITANVKNEAFISFQGGGAKDFKMVNSTAYQTGEGLLKYFMRYNNSVRIDRLGWTTSDHTTITYTNNTFYKVASGQWANYSSISSYSNYYIQKNIWYDCTQNGDIARRIMGNGHLGNNSTAIWRYNTYWNDGSAVNQGNYDDSETALTTDPGFADAAHGDFTISGADQLEYGTGDSRWGGWIGGIVYEEINGLCYAMDMDSKTKAATVTYLRDDDGSYLGAYNQETIEIPSSVTYKGRTFPVTSIGAGAFSNCQNLNHIDIPASVTTIEGNAFASCRNLTHIDIPSSVTTIEESAFQSSGLESIVLPQGLTTIDSWVFGNCSNLSQVEFPESLREIGDAAFYGCRNLSQVELPEGLREIGGSAFYGCRNLSQVELPEGLETIGSGAFYGCPFTQINIPASVSSIGTQAFSISQAFHVDAANACYSSQDGVLFNKDKTVLIQAPYEIAGTYTMPTSVQTIEEQAFISTSKLTTVVLSPSLTTIGAYAFYYSGITSVEFPPSLTYIGSNAFNYSQLSGEVNIPSGVVNNEWYMAFSSCSNLSAINIADDNPSASSDKGVVYNKEKSQLLMMPQGFEGAYSVLPTATTIGRYDNDTYYGESWYAAIEDCPKLTALHIPASVSMIAIRSLRRVPQLSTITVDEASESFTIVDGVLFDKQVKTLYWFPENREGSYEVPEGVEALNQEAFLYAEKLQHITIPASVSKLGSQVFNCFYLEDITWLRGEPLELEQSYTNLQGDGGWRYVGYPNRAFVTSRYNNVGYTEYATLTFYVPESSVGIYKGHAQWGTLGFDIQPITTTGIDCPKVASKNAEAPAIYYTLDGKKLNGKPQQKGIYIVNGNKVAIK